MRRAPPGASSVARPLPRPSVAPVITIVRSSPMLSAFRRRCRLVAQFDLLDHLRLAGPAPGADVGPLYRVDRIHAVGDLPEDGVLAVQPGRGVRGDDEELRAIGVRAGVRHRQRPADDLVVVDLVLERVAGTAGPGPLRAAALDHEVLDHAVEDEAVVEAVAGELAEVLDRLRRILVEEANRYRAGVGLQGRLGHRDNSNDR